MLTFCQGLRSEANTSLDDPADVALVKGENLQQGFVDWRRSRFWPTGDAESFEKFELQLGDVVLAMDRPWVTAGLKWAYIRKFTIPRRYWFNAWRGCGQRMASTKPT